MDFPYCKTHDWSGRTVGGDYCRDCRYINKPIYHSMKGRYLGTVIKVVDRGDEEPYYYLKTDTGTSIVEHRARLINLFDKVWYTTALAFDDKFEGEGTIEGFYSTRTFNVQDVETGRKIAVRPERLRLNMEDEMTKFFCTYCSMNTENTKCLNNLCDKGYENRVADGLESREDLENPPTRPSFIPYTEHLLSRDGAVDFVVFIPTEDTETNEILAGDCDILHPDSYRDKLVKQLTPSVKIRILAERL